MHFDCEKLRALAYRKTSKDDQIILGFYSALSILISISKEFEMVSYSTYYWLIYKIDGFLQ
ncbi:MAG TPA: hypothetical protein DCX03_08355 [Bacteroidales bacterium]|nr:hypothetical protein [Bacteroidales bacterium]